MWAGPVAGYGCPAMPKFVLAHSHQSRSCGTAYAAWSGFDSPLRHKPAVSSCGIGGHRIFWVVEASDAGSALTQLPEWLAARTVVSEVTEVTIP
jgi:hypothetical protein